MNKEKIKDILTIGVSAFILVVDWLLVLVLFFLLLLRLVLAIKIITRKKTK